MNLQDKLIVDHREDNNNRHHKFLDMYYLLSNQYQLDMESEWSNFEDNTILLGKQ